MVGRMRKTTMAGVGALVALIAGAAAGAAAAGREPGFIGPYRVYYRGAQGFLAGDALAPGRMEFAAEAGFLRGLMYLECGWRRRSDRRAFVQYDNEITGVRGRMAYSATAGLVTLGIGLFGPSSFLATHDYYELDKHRGEIRSGSWGVLRKYWDLGRGRSLAASLGIPLSVGVAILDLGRLSYAGFQGGGAGTASEPGPPGLVRDYAAGWGGKHATWYLNWTVAALDFGLPGGRIGLSTRIGLLAMGYGNAGASYDVYEGAVGREEMISGGGWFRRCVLEGTWSAGVAWF